MSIHETAWSGTLDKTSLDGYLKSCTIDDQSVKFGKTRGLTPLAIATFRGHINTVEILLQNGADVDAHSSHGRTALWIAANKTEKNRGEIVRLLLEKKPDVDATAAALDYETPLMGAIRQFRDPKVISMLVDAGASKTRENADKETAELLAQKTGDAAVLGALQDKSQRIAGRAELIQMIVSVILFIISWVNNTLVKDVIHGVVKDVYNISGLKDDNISKTFEKEPQSAAEFKDNINDYVTENHLNKFFAPDDPFLQTVARKAVELKNNPNTTLKTDEDIKDLTRLSLYQPVIYCDDSGSMESEGRAVSQRAIVKSIAQICTLLVPDNKGVHLRFINADRRDNDLQAEGIERAMEAVKPSGYTEIGLNLRKKILQPFVYDLVDRGVKLDRPFLISIITDGVPGGKSGVSKETVGTLKDVIAECADKLMQNGYEPESVIFQISQIGSDKDSKQFLDSLRGDSKLSDILYVTANRLDDQYRDLQDNFENLERWFFKMLMAPILNKELS